MLWALSTILLWQASVGKRYSSTKQVDFVVDEQERNATKSAAQDKLTILSLDDSTPLPKRLKLAKTRAFKQLWPIQCNVNAVNTYKKPLRISTDGFSCDPDNKKVDAAVAEIINPRWQNQQFICCKQACVAKEVVQQKGSPCKGLKPKGIAEAVQVAALGVTGLETVSGQKVGIQTRMAAPKVTKETGLIATVEVRMMGEALEFESGTEILTANGARFLQDLEKPLAALLSMQVTMTKGSSVKILFCPHAATTAASPEDVVNGVLLPDTKLPEARVLVLKDYLRNKLPSGTCTLGNAIAHYNRGRFGSIIYKILNADVSAATECKKEDLDQFNP